MIAKHCITMDDLEPGTPVRLSDDGLVRDLSAIDAAILRAKSPPQALKAAPRTDRLKTPPGEPRRTRGKALGPYKPRTQTKPGSSGDYIRYLRINRGLTMSQLDAACGFADKYVSNLERGASLPSTEALLKMAVALSLSSREWQVLLARRVAESFPDMLDTSLLPQAVLPFPEAT